MIIDSGLLLLPIIITIYMIYRSINPDQAFNEIIQQNDKMIFDSYDVDQSGLVDPIEFDSYVRDMLGNPLSVDLDSEYVQAQFDGQDVDNSGDLSLDEFKLDYSQQGIKDIYESGSPDKQMETMKNMYSRNLLDAVTAAGGVAAGGVAAGGQDEQPVLQAPVKIPRKHRNPDDSKAKVLFAKTNAKSSAKANAKAKDAEFVKASTKSNANAKDAIAVAKRAIYADQAAIAKAAQEAVAKAAENVAAASAKADQEAAAQEAAAKAAENASAKIQAYNDVKYTHMEKDDNLGGSVKSRKKSRKKIRKKSKRRRTKKKK
jgi:hypothetical protein